MKVEHNANLEASEVIGEMPAVCADETLAFEFFEKQMWGDAPRCAHCGDTAVYQMRDLKTGQRNKRFLWRCHACKKQFTVRVGTVLEESRIPLHHWAYAMWRMSTSKKGVAALEIKRHCQITYRAALFLLHRIRFAMTPPDGGGAKLKGWVEVDETYVGGKPRPQHGVKHKVGRGTEKTPVFGMVENGGSIKRMVVADVSAKTLKAAIREHVDKSAVIMSDEWPSYRGLHKEFAGHQVVCHKEHEYVRDDGVTTNTAESSFAILKRGIMGIYHSVSKKHLPRYVNEFDFRWNTRKVCDGDRITAAVQGAVGKRLDYKTLTQ